MWVYETDEFKQAIIRHNLGPRILECNESIESCQTRSDVGQRLIPRWPWYLYKKENYRLIGGIEVVGDRDIFVWYRVLKRGDSEYTPFKNLTSDAIRRGLSVAKLEEWVFEQDNLERERNLPESLPDEYYLWFQPIRAIAAGLLDPHSDSILESPEWVKTIREIGQRDINAFSRAIAKLANLPFDERHINDIVEISDSDAVSILATRLDARTWYLLRPVHSSLKKAVGRPEIPSLDWALRSASRAYPSWLLADPQLWIAIQQDEAANLALSVEETKLLASVAGEASNQHSLPLFINGQAGSGKSTMLAYIFAGFCKHKIDNMIDGEPLGGSPLFVTYSDKLIVNARKATSKILHKGFDTVSAYQEFDTTQLFVTWHEYLIKLLPPENRERFSADRRIDFSKFRNALENKKSSLGRFQGTTGRLSPETIWFVIRSLIKGTESVGDLLPEDYESEIPEQDRIVSSEDYKEIYERYFNWYKNALSQNELWDDLDLVKQVLSLETLPQSADRTVAALVIDEAQDFTRCELRLITRTLLYSNYSIKRNTNVRVPLVFAGDPLQTLSPTGFKWKTIGSGLYEELHSIVGDSAERPIFRQLQNNYRSLAPIVGMANMVQLWRKIMFGVEVSAQGAWNPDEFARRPERFLVNDGSQSLKELSNFLQETPIIVPCDDGGEIEFVQNDEILSQIFPDASQDTPPPFVYSANSVKGLEFKKIVIYKFGDYKVPDIQWARKEQEHPDLSAEYFFNKLYVALTRATQNLFVVDTQKSSPNLWNFFTDQRAASMTGENPDFLEPLDSDGIPGELIGLVDGISLEGLEEENPRDNAVNTMHFGISTGDPRHLRRAQTYFRQIRDSEMVSYCGAYALMLEDEFEKASREFLGTQEYPLAWECAWKSGNWELMGNVISVNPAVAPDLFRFATLYMATLTTKLTDTVEMLTRIDAEFGRPNYPTLESGAWKVFISKVVANYAQQNSDSEDMDSVALAFDHLGRVGFLSCAELAGDLYLRQGRLIDAINSWARVGSKTIERVAIAKFKLEGAPNGLRFLSEANLHQQIVDEWTALGKPVESRWLDYLKTAFMALRKAAEGFDILISVGAVNEALNLLVDSDPEMSRYHDRYQIAARELGSTFDFGSLLKLIETARVQLNDVEDSKRPIHHFYAVGIDSAVRRYNANGWGTGNPSWISSFRTLLDSRTGISSWRLDYRLKLIKPLILGAAYELGEQWVKASEVYETEVNSADPWLKTMSRQRWLYCQNRLEAEVKQARDELQKSGRRRTQGDEPSVIQKNRIAMASSWRINSTELRRINQSHVPQLEIGEIRKKETQLRGNITSGNFDLAFELRDRESDARIIVSVENKSGDGDIDFANIQIKEQKARFRKLDTLALDGEILLSDESWDGHSVLVSLKNDVIVQFLKDDTEIAEYLVLEADSVDQTVAARKIASRRITPVDRESMKVFNLAQELKVDMTEMKKALLLVGIRGKDGNSRLSGDQVDRIRKHFSK